MCGGANANGPLFRPIHLSAANGPDPLSLEPLAKNPAMLLPPLGAARAPINHDDPESPWSPLRRTWQRGSRQAGAFDTHIQRHVAYDTSKGEGLMCNPNAVPKSEWPAGKAWQPIRRTTLGESATTRKQAPPGFYNDLSCLYEV